MTAKLYDFSAEKAARIAAGTRPRPPTVATIKRAIALLAAADVPERPPIALEPIDARDW